MKTMRKTCIEQQHQGTYVNGECTPCSNDRAINYYYNNREAIAQKRRARREFLNGLLAAQNKKD